MFNVILTHKAFKNLETIHAQDKRIIIQKLKEYAENPQKYAIKLVNPKLGMYRFRIGNYRAIFDIIEDDIVILKIGHRRDIYK